MKAADLIDRNFRSSPFDSCPDAMQVRPGFYCQIYNIDISTRTLKAWFGAMFIRTTWVFQDRDISHDQLMLMQNLFENKGEVEEAKKWSESFGLK